jgi:hypothetical protein
MNRYQLTVRGETVHLTFKRINDSRRLHSYQTSKKPNLFGIRAAMVCRIEVPPSLAPQWWRVGDVLRDHPYSAQGTGFCYRADQWNSTRGRHEAIKEALGPWCDDGQLRGEIMTAFLAEEQRRAAPPKGPATQPKTAAPKPRRPSQRQLLARAVALLEQIAQRPAFVVSDTIYDDAKMLVEQTAQRLGAGGTHPQYLPQYLKPGSGESLIGAAEKVRPADSTPQEGA